MAWSYCEGCDEPLSEPTHYEVAVQEQECPHCGRRNDPNKSIGELLTELIVRIEALEARP